MRSNLARGHKKRQASPLAYRGRTHAAHARNVYEFAAAALQQ